VRCRNRARILRIGICRSEQRRGAPGDTSNGHEDREKDVLRKPLELPYSDALQSACRDSDHCQPDDYPRDAKLLVREDNFPRKWQRCLARQRYLVLFVFAFPTHESAQPPTHFFDRMFFGFPQ
jgi:hypothetical protein